VRRCGVLAAASSFRQDAKLPHQGEQPDLAEDLVRDSGNLG
jgi:hypothetical protein